MTRREFGILNLVVEVTKDQVKIWACDPKTGENKFRLKATGEVISTSLCNDVIVRQVSSQAPGGE